MTLQTGFKTDCHGNTISVLDRTKFQSLANLIGNEKAAVALQKFRDDLESHIAAISEEATPTEEKGARAHKLVGTAGAIGLDELSHESRRFEEAVKRNVSDLRPFVDDLMSAAERARAELNGI